jgi:two-component system C4-dicarboxylate transport sensor histidine kinase DctB
VTLVDVSRLVERALGFRRYHLARARIVVAVDGPGPGEALSRLDASYLQQILLNLIINAEHSLASQTDGRIEIRIATTAEIVEVRVIDNGVGLPQDLAPRLAEPFFTTKQAAAGLGLTVAAGLADMLGGRLELQNRVGGGALALLTLPAATRPQQATPRQQPTSNGTAAP